MPQESDVIVIGAGLAGCSAARSIAERGLSVTIIDQHPEPAQETSGNPAGIFMPVLEAADSPRERLYLDAFEFLIKRLRSSGESVKHQLCGVVQLPRDDKIRQRFNRVKNRTDLDPDLFQYIPARKMEALTGKRLPDNGLYFPQAGWLSPPSLCHWLLDHQRITFHANTAVAKLYSQDGQWVASNASGQSIHRGSSCVITAGHTTPGIQHANWLPIQQVSGQITHLRFSHPHHLQTIVCHRGYALPSDTHDLLIGATYNRDRLGYEPSARENKDNEHALVEAIPEFEARLPDSTALGGRVGHRAVVPGRMPVAGRLMPPQQFKGTHQSTNYQDLYISTAHASRGILSSGLCGEIIASLITEEAHPFLRHEQTVNPSRFLRKNSVEERQSS
jgi:tRNA 5-methylaminomethyl-2-thiouridine biosynthesis bifunctional protein